MYLGLTPTLLHTCRRDSRRPGSGEDRAGIAAAETTRRPRGLRRVSWTGCVVSTGTLEAWPKTEIPGRLASFEVPVNPTYRHRNTVP
jgi:hypothetical protein